MTIQTNCINKTQYPMVTVNLKKLYHNAKITVDNCKKSSIKIAGIIKGCNGIAEVGLNYA